jgi:MiaB/RimO family radical SAM methylthiotransferase
MRIYVEEYGCWLNKALTRYVEQLVRAEGAVLVKDPKDADAVIVNTCAVRADTERKILARLRELSALGKRVAVTGCLVNVRPYSIEEAAPGASLVDPSCLDELRRFVRGENVWLVREYRRRLHAYRHEGGVRYVLPVQTGCTGRCGFCVEPIVRRGVSSLDPEVAVELVKDAVRMGAKEIYLTGQDVAAYGVDLGVKLTDLVERILEEVDGDYVIRLGMMEPWMTKAFAEKLAAILKDERMYKYLHLPLQSGDDGILKRMGRRYTVAEYKALVALFRRELNELSVVTDVIVGYPGETEEAFNNTLRVVEELAFDKVHVARYTFRPFTPAYVEKGTVPEPEKKRRSKLLSRLAAEVAARVNSRYAGRTVRALVTEDRRRAGTLIARTLTYKPVVIPEVAEPGEWVKVKVTAFTPHYLIGEVVD